MLVKINPVLGPEDFTTAGNSYLIAIKRVGLILKDIEVMECNEAFAVQNLTVINEMENQAGIKIDHNKWNLNGGSGARMCIFAMKELARRDGKYGLFSSCCNGGYGVTTLIENLRV